MGVYVFVYACLSLREIILSRVATIGDNTAFFGLNAKII